MRVSDADVAEYAKVPRRPKVRRFPKEVTLLARDLKDAKAKLEEARGIARQLANELELTDRRTLPLARKALDEFYMKILTR